jgi:hypothetical protein
MLGAFWHRAKHMTTPQTVEICEEKDWMTPVLFKTRTSKYVFSYLMAGSFLGRG